MEKGRTLKPKAYKAQKEIQIQLSEQLKEW